MDHESKWLTYWILFALSCVLDSMPFVHYIIPYFSLVRFVFLFLCMIPQVDLATTIYDKVIVPKILVVGLFFSLDCVE
ncbi:uncharacterized protein [Blastocystis hominis]|uniref:Receptor expression-enhancing protein n=1 Tax=Blastocystis hominis TaxID=12968 RepID=D8MBG9_BLAHO|nr:uncharacterized protein [Blastocystis hominis]CBK25408.2 unnamed protein product [Blastocystis hominis]|eukprot:XP_012899456.1 uncharacterized protein [Blastocystis hominis]